MDNQELKACLYLGCVLPLLKSLQQPDDANDLVDNKSMQFCVHDVDQANLSFVIRQQKLEVTADTLDNADLTCRFRSARQAICFFSGKLALPSIRGLWRNPRLLFRLLRMLKRLQLLAPARRDEVSQSPQQQQEYVQLTIHMLVLALSLLNRLQDEDMQNITRHSPDRVYQWTVEDIDYGVYLRVQQGKSKAGVGHYDRLTPFVHFRFPDVASAFAVLTHSGSQMRAVTDKLIVTEGSQDYARKLSRVMQKIDALLNN